MVSDQSFQSGTNAGILKEHLHILHRAKYPSLQVIEEKRLIQGMMMPMLTTDYVCSSESWTLADHTEMAQLVFRLLKQARK